MKTSEKILFGIGCFFAVVALFCAAFATVLGVSALISVAEESKELGEAIGMAFELVFMVIFSVAAWAASLLSAILLFAGPTRTAHMTVRRVSRILLISLLVLCIVPAVLWVLCLV